MRTEYKVVNVGRAADEQANLTKLLQGGWVIQHATGVGAGGANAYTYGGYVQYLLRRDEE